RLPGNARAPALDHAVAGGGGHGCIFDAAGARTRPGLAPPCLRGAARLIRWWPGAGHHGRGVFVRIHRRWRTSRLVFDRAGEWRRSDRHGHPDLHRHGLDVAPANYALTPSPSTQTRGTAGASLCCSAIAPQGYVAFFGSSSPFDRKYGIYAIHGSADRASTKHATRGTMQELLTGAVKLGVPLQS